MLARAMGTGKFEGTGASRRKEGAGFTARVVLTPRREYAGYAIGFLRISKDVSDDVRLSQELETTQIYTRSLNDALRI